MIQTQTLEFVGNDDERAMLEAALSHMANHHYDAAARIMIARLDKINAKPILKPYDQREARA